VRFEQMFPAELQRARGGDILRSANLLHCH